MRRRQGLALSRAAVVGYGAFLAAVLLYPDGMVLNRFFVGVYAVHATTFDLVLMVVLGIFGWGLRKLGFPMAPLILGFVLGDMMEQNLRRALSISDGHPAILFQSPVTLILWGLAATVLVVPFLLRRRKKKP